MCPERIIRRPLSWLPSVRNNDVPYAAEEFHGYITARTTAHRIRLSLCCADGKLDHDQL